MCVRLCVFDCVCVFILMSGPWGVRLSLIDVGEVWPLRQTRTLAPTTGPGKMAPGVIRQMDELSLRPIQAAHEKQGRHTEPPPPPALTEAQRGNRWRAGGRVGGLLRPPYLAGLPGSWAAGRQQA